MRSIGESLEYDIPAMWKYENLTPWLVDGKYVLVNDTLDIKYPKMNQLIVVDKDKNAKVSLYKRAASQTMPANLEDLWVGVPSPDADEFASNNNYKINYSYDSFLIKNNKFTQKGLLGDLTPNWYSIASQADIDQVLKSKAAGYFKRRYGSGGYTIFKTSEATHEPKFLALFAESPNDWFFEDEVTGIPCSVQFVKYKSDESVVLFGFTEQIVDAGKYFIGSKIQPLSALSSTCLRQIEEAIDRLSPILRDYEGFFGLDFILSEDGNISVLEANVRLTSATIPALLSNLAGGVGAIYREDLIQNPSDIAIVLTVDTCSHTVDQLQFFPNFGVLGKTISFQLVNCGVIHKFINERNVQELKKLVDTYIGESTNSTLKNFWPYGWTICFILEESHCVVSSWFLERKILVDIFSCNADIDAESVTKAFSEFFASEEVLDLEIKQR